jgi:hypothetical protein
MAKAAQPDKPRIFISYSRQDAAMMRRLEQGLRAANAQVWVDHAGIRSGDNLPKRISDALEWCNVLLLLWSASAKASKWVEDEWTNAHSLGRRIIPCLLDDTPRPGILASKVYVDFRRFEEGLNELLHSLGFPHPLAASPAATPPPVEKRIDHGLLPEAIAFAKPRPPSSLPILRLRSQPRADFSGDDVQKMLTERDFFDAYKNKSGKGLPHEYEAIERHGEKLVIDHATGLTWQQSGSKDSMTYADAENYIRELNKKGVAGYNDWRLPTLEEAMSLMEPSEKHGDLYIDPVFDKTQRWIWTADKLRAGVAWVVSFGSGYCRSALVVYSFCVRAVR